MAMAMAVVHGAVSPEAVGVAEDGVPINTEVVGPTATRTIGVLGPMVNGAGTMAVRWAVNGGKPAIKTTATRTLLNFALNFDRNGAVSGTMSAGFATLSSPTLRAPSIPQSPPNQPVPLAMRRSRHCRRRVSLCPIVISRIR